MSSKDINNSDECVVDKTADESTALTAQERAALLFLDNLMEAPALSIGRAIYNAAPGKGSNLTALGATVCARLRKRGLVTRLPDLAAWRITSEGRRILWGVKND